MNENVKELLETIKILVENNALEVEMKACALDTTYLVETVEELNNYLRESMSYWEE